ncbi:hypothetical protein L596_002026 [Steinernema carpocapsae]|uniref:Uncharacterized protein n=1 Tax=Steinernema carpocapsae TaxID=34508 RepID=A0A4U8UMV0_STECR|nr:hypothetical protein L596_002026 [Steinernema carpocapsae]
MSNEAWPRKRHARKVAHSPSRRTTRFPIRSPRATNQLAQFAALFQLEETRNPGGFSVNHGASEKSLEKERKRKTKRGRQSAVQRRRLRCTTRAIGPPQSYKFRSAENGEGSN